ncbi:MAG: hypothetical protein HETSPECPRED_001874 [Heterodermia speciosa]|uniref:Helicase C-terminal domain-containing protein n=1 Tax=Heterodermia speciosa TaxID=116794 RepID=A0A8H3PFI6_9LECA|nr:MAG: hypothetical protein HETSPECPRED_001874 [Heterodermia speciosa]
MPPRSTVAEKEDVIVRNVYQTLHAQDRRKAVVDANSMGKVQCGATRLECNTYLSNITDTDLKPQILRDGKQSVIGATDALGLGVDIPEFRLVLHHDLHRNLLDYGLESGRAGSGGNVSEAWNIARVGPQLTIIFGYSYGFDGNERCNAGQCGTMRRNGGIRFGWKGVSEIDHVILLTPRVHLACGTP